MAKFIKVGAGWRTKSGKMISWQFEADIAKGQRLFSSDNKFKTEDKHPDYTIGYFEEEEKTDEIPF